MKYKKSLATVRQEKQAAFMRTCEQLITTQHPELKGRFSALHIWEDLQYLYTVNGITPETAAARILKTDYSTVILPGENRIP